MKLNSSKQPKIFWAEIENPEKYYVYRKAKGDEDYNRIKLTSSTSFTDKEAKKGTTYYYRVKAIHKNTGANSALSDYAKIKKP